ncbi:MAG: multicopper oxidase domain-containing protein [Pseudomonadota bacterium]
MNLFNNLPKGDPSCQEHPENINIPHCFNSTNLHTHGLWVSPSGNSDNIFLTVRPGVSFEHEYNIPADHPAGTFWYHPHLHGSTALQVSSGMSGALILRGDRMPTPEHVGDLDVLLRPTAEQPFRERIMLFQQLAYACRDDAGRIKTEPADDDEGIWVCDKGDIGGVERYLGPVKPNQFGGGSWIWSGRHTSVNGRILPTIRGSKVGQFERWRMIHAGVRDTVSVEVRKLDESADSIEGLSAFETADYIARHCDEAHVPMHLVAADGLTMRQAQEVSHAVMQPGYRWDALVAFPEAGRYCLVDATDPPGGGLQGAEVIPPRLIGIIEVEDGAEPQGTAAEALTAALVSAAEANIAESIVAGVIADIEDGLQLAAFSPHDDLVAEEIDGTQDVVYNIDITTDPVRYEVNGEVFSPDNIRQVRLGDVEDWVLSSTWEGHPHHIHVNPFQIIEVLDPTGKDVSAPGAVDDFTGQIDSQFAGMKGMWKDTIWVKNPKKSPDETYTVRVRTQYRRYIGSFVFHCHILDHEDQGMMQTVEIVLPDGRGGSMAHGHGAGGHGSGGH